MLFLKWTNRSDRCVTANTAICSQVKEDNEASIVDSGRKCRYRYISQGREYASYIIFHIVYRL